MSIIIALILSLVSGLGGTANHTEAPAPTVCQMVAPGVGSDSEVDGQDFLAWRDYVSEDGELNYDGRGDLPAGTWSIDLWDDAGREVVGYSIEEDSDIWNTMDCAARHEAYTEATEDGTEGGGETISGIYKDSELDCIIGPDGTKAWQNPGTETPAGWENIGPCETD